MDFVVWLVKHVDADHEAAIRKADGVARVEAKGTVATRRLDASNCTLQPRRRQVCGAAPCFEHPIRPERKILGTRPTKARERGLLSLLRRPHAPETVHHAGRGGGSGEVQTGLLGVV